MSIVNLLILNKFSLWFMGVRSIFHEITLMLDLPPNPCCRILRAYNLRFTPNTSLKTNTRSSISQVKSKCSLRCDFTSVFVKVHEIGLHVFVFIDVLGVKKTERSKNPAARIWVATEYLGDFAKYWSETHKP